MRYAEQIKYSWGYHWGILCEIWDMFTLRKWHWFVVGLLFAVCIVPRVGGTIPFSIYYYITTTVPSFAPSLSQELAITDYLSKALPVPSIPVVVSYYWVRGSGFVILANGLCIASTGLLMAAYLREGRPVRGREE